MAICNKCNGSGVDGECWACKGTGIDEGDSCEYCDGTGKNECRLCEGTGQQIPGQEYYLKAVRCRNEGGIREAANLYKQAITYGHSEAQEELDDLIKKHPTYFDQKPSPSGSSTPVKPVSTPPTSIPTPKPVPQVPSIRCDGIYTYKGKEISLYFRFYEDGTAIFTGMDLNDKIKSDWFVKGQKKRYSLLKNWEIREGKYKVSGKAISLDGKDFDADGEISNDGFLLKLITRDKYKIRREYSFINW